MAAGARRDRRRRGTSGGNATTPPTLPTSSQLPGPVGRSRAGARCRSSAGRRRGSTSGSDESGGATTPPPMPTTQQLGPGGRSSIRAGAQRDRRRRGTSGGDATTSPRTSQQHSHPAETTNNNDVGETLGVRYTRDVDCACDSCILRQNGAAGIAKWSKSEAKAIIRDSLLSDKTHKYWNDPPAKIYDDNKVLFHQYKFQNFSNNIRGLKRGISSEQEKTDFDEIAFKRESNAFPRGLMTSHGNPYYDTSETKKILVKLAKDGDLEKYKHRPRDLKSSNPIFQEFNSKVFAKAVNREKRRVKESVGWQLKRNIQGSKKHNAKYDKIQDARGEKEDGIDT